MLENKKLAIVRVLHFRVVVQGQNWSYRDNGKENGNYYITMGYILGLLLSSVFLRCWSKLGKLVWGSLE